MPHELDVVSYKEGYGRGFDEALRLVERYGYVLNAPRMVINGAGYDGWHPEDEFPKKITITEQQLDIEKHAAVQFVVDCIREKHCNMYQCRYYDQMGQQIDFGDGDRANRTAE